MDYEQKYKDLVKAVKELREANPSDEGIQNWVNENCPELKESRDEKIRKELVQFIKNWKDHNNIGRPHDFPTLTRNVEQCDRYIAWLEKQGDKKPINKVEPKFHEGEWLCENELNNYARFIQILEIVNVQGKERYRISRDLHNDEDIVECRFVENNYHPFNIRDAKDGDILAAYECLVLFREIDGLNIRCYCTYHFMNNPSFHVETLHNKDAFHPATKEQREQLEKAMADAGYTFDFDKKELKELKKIEQKPDEWSEKYKEAIEIGVIALDDLEPNDTYYGYTMPFGEAINWLKLLKDKVQPKQKDWSKEYEWKFFDILALLRGGENCHYNTPDLFEWFKSLKDRYTWKPSDEQMEALDWALSLAKNCGEECAFYLRTLQDQLKKLKE